MTPKKTQPSPAAPPTSERGAGGELHQIAPDPAHALTSNQGLVVADNQNSLHAGVRGPTLLEDFLLREKITHFDHERIPERVVHARGYGAHGYFESYADHSTLTRAEFLRPGERTPVFVRFSTVAGSLGSVDTARDVRGFAVKFYTRAGNFDLVGNNIPVFFIQDAIKFPDLVHSVKPEQDRDFPQAQSAHDSFWDFVTLNPESMHMLMWVMSDRALPRSFRMMEGFGVHSFRFINEEGVSNFVKFHWRPKLGSASLLWDEAVKLSGADPDFHRRDLWQAIERGDYPEYELSVQVVSEDEAEQLDFDILDATKLIPEEVVPLTPLGRMVLDRNVDNFFAETEQVAFCPSHLVPGIDFSDDPLLQGRLFSYLDTQLSRLGSSNFQQIPINRPKCPWHNMQRGGHMQMEVHRGRTAHEPSALDDGRVREHPSGFQSYPAAMPVQGAKRRLRAESFADHYTQARMFWVSMTQPEKRHIASAFAFELGKVETPAIRAQMLGHLEAIHTDLAAEVGEQLGMASQPPPVTPARPAGAMPPSAALSILGRAPHSIEGKKIGVLIGDGIDREWIGAFETAVRAEGARIELIAPKIGGAKASDGTSVPVVHFLAGAPSVLFDALVVAPGDAPLEKDPDALEWLRNGFRHLKVIGYAQGAVPLFERAALPQSGDPGIVSLDTGLSEFIEAAKRGRCWDRPIAG